jgi:hypothetical protein
MARMFVASTPATRGEVQGSQVSDSGGDPFAGLSDELLSAAAAARGYKLVSAAGEKPSANAKRDEWAAYARTMGATPAELEGLGRNDIRDRYGDAASAATVVAPAPGEPSAQDGAKLPEDEGPKKSGQPVAQTTSATRPSATQDSASPASESKVKAGKG